MVKRLLPCPSCGRHVKSAERSCPFCAAPVAEAFAAVPEARAIPNGLSRAALAAIAAASISACGGESTDAVPAYGAPVPTGGATSSGGTTATGGTTAAGGRPATGGAIAQPYGVPPLTGGTVGAGGRPATGGSTQEPADAGDDGASGGTTGTGGAPATGGIQAVPPYGIPPIPDYGAPPPPSAK